MEFSSFPRQSMVSSAMMAEFCLALGPGLSQIWLTLCWTAISGWLRFRSASLSLGSPGEVCPYGFPHV
jgi:hypothetical protein